MAWQSLLNRSFLIIALNIALGATLSSCNSSNYNAEQVNLEFQAKFQSQVAQINSGRIAPQPTDPNAPQDAGNFVAEKSALSPFNSPDELLGVAGAYKNSSASVDTSKLSLKKAQDFTPDAQTFSEAQSALAQSRLPEDMFDITYNTELSQPFIFSGIEFDLINIPAHDAYGVNSNLSEKQYALAGNSSLQKNVDQVLASRSHDDIEFSETLVREQKQLQREQKIINIFGSETLPSEKTKIIDAKKDSSPNEKEKLAFEDPLKKAIALQIIQQNLKQNSATASSENGKDSSGNPTQKIN